MNILVLTDFLESFLIPKGGAFLAKNIGAYYYQSPLPDNLTKINKAPSEPIKPEEPVTTTTDISNPPF